MDAAAPAETPPEGYLYDSFGRLVVKSKESTVKESKPAPAPLFQWIGGLIALIAAIFASGWLMNYSFSANSPLLNENKGPDMFTDGATAKYTPAGGGAAKARCCAFCLPLSRFSFRASSLLCFCFAYGRQGPSHRTFWSPRSR